MQYNQPIPPTPYSFANTGNVFQTTISNETRRPFYINVNPVYPTSEKFNNLAPYPNVEVTIVSSPPPSPTTPVSNTYETTYSTTTLKVPSTEEVDTASTPLIISSSEETLIPETSPSPTTVTLPYLFKPSEDVSILQTAPNVQLHENDIRGSFSASTYNHPPALSKQSINVSPLPTNYGQHVSQPVPAVPIFRQNFAPAPTAFPSNSIPVSPSALPTIQNNIPSSLIPYSNNMIPLVQNVGQAQCPCYVMTKNEDGVTSTTTQSSVVTLKSPPAGILLLLYPLCPGDTLENVQKIQPSLSSAFIVPYQCGQCGSNQQEPGLQQFRTFQEAIANGANTFNKPTWILNTQNTVPAKQTRITRRRINHVSQSPSEPIHNSY